MSLLGWPFLALLTVVSCVLLLAVAVGWNRWPAALQPVARGLSLVVVMAVGAALAGALLNRSFGFYTSFGDLLAVSAATYEPPPSFGSRAAGGDLVIAPADWRQRGAEAARSGRGIVASVTFAGARSGITRAGLVYLPAAYFTTSAHVQLPVLELFHGYPGEPRNMVDQLGIGRVLDREIAARRMPAVIAAMPATYAGRASECVNGVRGQRTETYLAVDVPADLRRGLRVLPGRSFAALGYSEGGFCAVNLGLHHPDEYAAAASLSGYFTAGVDRGTRALYAGRRAALLGNSPLWWVGHRRPTGPPLFLMASGGDPYSLRQIRLLEGVATRRSPKLPIVTGLVTGGGHNFTTWGEALPAALDFVGRYLPMSLAPAVHLPPVQPG